MTERDPMDRRMDQDHGGAHEAGQLSKQTPGLDEGETSAMAGPGWDEELVGEARESMPGESLEGEPEPGGRSGGGGGSVPSEAAQSARGLESEQGGGTGTRLGDAPVGGIDER